MPEYDYTIDDIDHVDMHLALHHEPSPAHVKVEYIVHLKNGETREPLSGALHGVAAAEAALYVLQTKNAIDPARQVEAHPWRQNHG